MSEDKRQEFARQVTEQLAARMKELAEKAKADRLMLTMDAIAAEAVRLKIESWDQITFAELRERLRLARAEERKALGMVVP